MNCVALHVSNQNYFLPLFCVFVCNYNSTISFLKMYLSLAIHLFTLSYVIRNFDTYFLARAATMQTQSNKTLLLNS